MTKQRKTTHTGSDLPDHELVTLVLEPLANLVDTARLEILHKIQKVAESVNIIARQIKRQIPEGE